MASKRERKITKANVNLKLQIYKETAAFYLFEKQNSLVGGWRYPLKGENTRRGIQYNPLLGIVKVLMALRLIPQKEIDQ